MMVSLLMHICVTWPQWVNCAQATALFWTQTGVLVKVSMILSPCSASNYITGLLHSPNCFTFLTLCLFTDIGNQGTILVFNIALVLWSVPKSLRISWILCSRVWKRFPFIFRGHVAAIKSPDLPCWIWCYVLRVEHISCYHKSWPTSVNHPHSFLNICSSLGLAGGNITRKLLFLSLDIFFKILVIQVIFSAIILFILTFYPSAQIGLEGYCRRLPGGRAGVTALPGAVLIGSQSNLVGTILGAGSRTSSFMGDVAH